MCASATIVNVSKTFLSFVKTERTLEEIFLERWIWRQNGRVGLCFPSLSFPFLARVLILSHSLNLSEAPKTNQRALAH